jgi:hypothetical protein
MSATPNAIEMNATPNEKKTVPKKRRTSKKDKIVVNDNSVSAASAIKDEISATNTKETVPKKRKTTTKDKKDNNIVVNEVTSTPDTKETSFNDTNLSINLDESSELSNNDNIENIENIENVVYNSNVESNVGTQQEEPSTPPQQREEISEEESFRRLKEQVKSQDKIKAQIKAQLEAQMRAQFKSTHSFSNDAENNEKCAHAFKNGFMNNDESNQFVIMTTVMKIIADLAKYADCNCQDEDAHEDCTYDYDKQIEQIKSLFMYLTTIPKFIKQYPQMIDMTMMKIQRFREKEKDNVVLKETYTYYDMFIKNLKEEMKREKEQKEKA